MNPHIEHSDGYHWGYSTVEFAEEACTLVACVDKHVYSPETEPVDVTAAYRNA